MRKSTKFVVGFASGGFFLPWAVAVFYTIAHHLGKLSSPGVFLWLWPSPIQLLVQNAVPFNLGLMGWLFLGSVSNSLIYVAVPFAIVVIYRFSRHNPMAINPNSHQSDTKP